MSTATRRWPLHPPLTDVPIGALVIVAVLDVISAVDAGGHSWARETYRAATFALMIGTAALVVAILFGLLDRAQVTSRGDRARRAVNVHAWVMTGVGVLSVADIVLRRHHDPGASHTPGAVLALTLVTLAVMLVGGALGGKLVYRAGLGVSIAQGDVHSIPDVAEDGRRPAPDDGA